MWFTLANDRALRACEWFAILFNFQNEQPHPLWYPLGQPESQNEHNLGQGSVDVFSKGSHSKYFRLCGPYTMSQPLNSAIVEKSRQYTSKWARLSSRKTLFIETIDLPVIHPWPRAKSLPKWEKSCVRHWDIVDVTVWQLNLLIQKRVQFPKSLKHWTLASLAGIQDTVMEDGRNNVWRSNSCYRRARTVAWEKLESK